MAAGRPGMSPETKAKIFTLHAQGLSDNQIANIIGCSSQNIYLFRHARGLKSNYKYHRTAPKPRIKESGGVHWSTVLSPGEWEVCKEFFRSVLAQSQPIKLGW
jgi:hypothetical protein